jgi:DNA modification methylase
MPVREQQVNDFYAAYHADCMEVMPDLPAESVGLAVYSPPFPELYQYSDDPRDMCNCVNYQEAIEQYRHVVGELARLTKPGRLNCVHCTDLKRGILYQHDFPGDIIRVHEDAGLHYFCRVAIWKDAWEFARRTRMKTLMHKTIVEDSSCSRLAPGDYLLVFKKPGKNAEPITHVEGFKNYAGGNAIPAELVREFAGYTGDQRKNAMSHWIYRQYASPVWMDIRRERIMPYEDGRENVEERHACPLQLDVIERCLALWSNPGDMILTPFMGVGSEVYAAVEMGRKGIGIELKATYYRQALKNIEAALRAKSREDFTVPVPSGNGEEAE